MAAVEARADVAPPGRDLATLHEVVETLAPLVRGAGSPGEQRAAHWLAERLSAVGVHASVDEEGFRDGYAALLLPPMLAALATGAAAWGGRRRGLAALSGALAVAIIADDVSNGVRLYRRAVTRPKTTWNVVAESGDPQAGRTLVVMAHHDAAPTGRIFDPSFQRWLARRFPRLVQRTNTGIPLWWPVVAAPAMTAAGAATRSRRLLGAGVAACAVQAALGADIARNRIVPGANDNLSGVAALVALAERLRERPLKGVRVLLASCGAEEVLQGGVYGFVERHLQGLDRARTCVLNLDTIGSPELVMVEGEGPFVMERYPGPGFRDRLERVTVAATGRPLRRGALARASTDAVIVARAGFASATLTSWEPDTKILSNYHLPSDVPENLRYDTVARAIVVAEALARDLATG